jgi:germacradienol/geosmin synthase
MAAARACNERLSLFMPVESSVVPCAVNGMERGLADLWARTAGPMTVQARRTFRRTIEDMIAGWLWELANQLENRVPDPVDYIEMRRETFGSDLTMSLSRLSHGRTVPPEIYRSRPIQAMEHAAADYACLLNDVFSYQKEIEFEGEIHNCVLVVENFFDCDYPEALDIVSGLMSSRLREFEHVVSTELPVLFDDFGLDTAARATLTGYADELKDWMAGILNWHRLVDRYQEAELLRPVGSPRGLLPGPTGLGTSAARLALSLARR